MMLLLSRLNIFIQKHTTDVQPSRESILDQSDLDAIITHAELTGKKFVAEKQRVVIISRDVFQMADYLNPRQKEEMEKHWNEITIPKRPHWDATTTTEELIQKENESFVEWRRSLSLLEQNEHLLLTPFEKNIEVWRQLWRVVERSTLVVQIVDARNPLLFRCVDLEKWVIAGLKRTLLLVNKADYLSIEQRRSWAMFFKKEGIEYVFFSTKSTETQEEIEESGEEEEDPSTKIVSREELLDLFIEECKKHRTTNTTTTTNNIPNSDRYVVGMVGYPNVGKSSTINVLLEEKKVAVSKTPGKTKHFQTINLEDRPITLCDCPGLVFPSFMSTRAEMVCNGLIRIAELRDVQSPIAYVCNKIPRNVLENTYGILLPKPKDHENPNRDPTPEELLNSYGYIRGYMTRHGVPDQSRSGKVILDDFVSGKLLYCHPPPGDKSQNFTSNIQNETRNTENDEETIPEDEETSSECEAHSTEEGPEVVVEECEADLGGIDLRTFEMVEKRDPNDHRRTETGRKHKRRMKQKIETTSTTNLTGAFKAGKRHVAYAGSQSGDKVLPTNIKLMGGKKFSVGKPTLNAPNNNNNN